VKQASKVFTNTLSFSHAIQQTKVFVALLKVREQIEHTYESQHIHLGLVQAPEPVQGPPIDCPSHQLHVHLLQQTTMKRETLFGDQK
jgi:hypothetical protein